MGDRQEAQVQVAALLCGLAAGVCEPNCSGKASGDKVKDPYDCTKYYVCLRDGIPSDTSLPCIPGGFFSEIANPPDCVPSLSCDWDVCVAKPCHLVCKSNLDRIVDKNNCSRFYHCQNGDIQGPFDCPAATPYFDGINCMSNQDVCCDLCIAYCPNYITEIPDPYDCNMYYFCQTAGEVNSANHFSCPAGEMYDPTAGHCVAGDACTPLCGTNNNCQDSMTCTSVGFFPKCKTCESQYFDCQYVGLQAIVGDCLGDKVFNTDPDYPHCIPPEECPFHPPH
nr:uncharacterized protein LOC123749462 [Procambarus clarkii]